ncbi:DUF2760 domain-containing protein [Paraliomyxa miuraensis]|uniref:DUF2760 domain-containing protein n=1 Tax=Paraliomyxa miuraensis TaxID=376150 RepID=UPI00225252FF|nr:DUF2760 domain-containing protein [Paraliomyxa miuraensis]MCX4247749.1 DUF2760 domain-containing protein [Paraliomyxa miuraensis]
MEPLAFGARLWLALTLPFRVLFDGLAARKIVGALEGELLSLSEAKIELQGELEAKARAPEPTVKEIAPEVDHTPALQLLAILQREGRFVDFLQEDVGGFSDADIGAAARVVHEGCTRGLKDVVTLAAIRSEAEGDAVELPAGYDANLNRVTGNVTGEPPFKGTLAHHGWRVEKIRLPELTTGHDPTIIAPAEVEL